MKLTPRAPDPVDVHIGERIRVRRISLHMSQTDLGNKLGITFQQIQKYEKGSNRLAAGRLQVAATALGVEVAYFYEGRPGITAHKPAPQRDAVVEMLSAECGYEVAEAFLAIADPGTRRMLRDLVRLLAGAQAAPRRHAKAA